MRTFVFRLFLAIAFVGVVGTVAAKEYSGGSGLARVSAPEGCASTVECGAVCAARPESCFNYCEADAAYSVECGRWAKAYHAAGGVTIAQAFAPPSGGGSFSSPSGGQGSGATPSPSSGGSSSFTPAPSGDTSGSMMGSPMGSPSMSSPPMGSPMGGPQTVGDQQTSQPGMTSGNQQGMMQPPLGRSDMRPGEPVSGSTPPATNFQQLPTGQEFPGQGMMGNQMGNQPGMQQGQPQMMGGPDMQTCRINGVEVQGRCEDLEKQTRKFTTGIDLGGGLRGTGPGGCRNPEECQEFCNKSDNKKECGGFADKFERPEFKQGNFEDRQSMHQGPGEMSEEQGEQQQERFEQERKRAEERMLQQMKQGMKQMTQMITQMERRIAGLVRRKVKIPAEVTSAMAELKALVVKAQNITDPSEMGEIGPQIGELVQTVNEQFGNLERLAEFPRVIVQANRMVRQMEAQLKRLETRINARKLDVGDALAEARTTLNAIKSAIEAAKVAAAQGDAEGAFEQLQAGVFEQGDTIGEKIFALEMIVQAPQRIAQTNRELRQMESRIKQFARKGKDMSEAKALLADARARLVTITALTKQKPPPIEEIMGLVEELEDVIDQIRDEIGEEQIPQFKAYELQLPSGLPVAPNTSVEPAPAATPVQ